MTKFEYKVIEIKPESMWSMEVAPELIEQNINKMGNEGWELVSTLPKTMTGSTVGITFIFKRPATF
ncbi:MAG: DUF4177 domain-containing protein [Runella slithyformis]|nr:MAG: DUF4177 domain-containing protein [Runella slithyformis]TAF23283.1 MAG: DUF4177 domain-containing protein [Runella slithyformis]TAF45711.1 MAG: DUF4177 domain-containing protein [Runella slithyformis]TAF81098.1 MAG: DUF4177 domain-containing protein [Runella slithyformis]